MHNVLTYSMAVFAIVLIASCALDLLDNHYTFQLAGIAFFFTYSIIRSIYLLQYNPDISGTLLYLSMLPSLSGISACLVGMVAGFWIFPPFREKFHD